MTDKIAFQNLQSQVINFLRFPLIVCVVFIHAASTDLIFPDHPFYNWSVEIFRGPLAFRNQFFFFISGFLFFINIRNLDISNYKIKLKNRFRTLFIPYIFWNFISFLFYIGVKVIAIDVFGIGSLINKPVPDNIIACFFQSFWAVDLDLNPTIAPFYPISAQLWFVRELMIVTIASPIIYLLIKCLRIYGVVSLGLLWYLWPKNGTLPGEFPGFAPVALFFFTAGAYLAFNKKNLIDIFGRIKKWSFIAYFLLVFAYLFTREYVFNEYIHRAMVLVAIISCFNLTAHFFKEGKLRPTPFLTSSAFWIFATHGMILSAIYKVIPYLFKPESDFEQTSLFFIKSILTIFISLGLYYISKRFLPKFTAVITGGR